MRHEAIRSVYPNVSTINGDDWGEIIAWDADGVEVDIDSSLVDAEEAKVIAAAKEAREAAELLVVTNKASAKSKLETLGLTADEIKDSFGI